MANEWLFKDGLFRAISKKWLLMSFCLFYFQGTNFINVAIWLTVNIITIDDFKMGQMNNDHQVSIQGIDFYYKFEVSHYNIFSF